MIQVKRKKIYDALQFNDQTHQQIKQIMQEQGYFVSEDATTISLLLLSDNGTLNKTINHTDWIVRFDNDKFLPLSDAEFNRIFEQV